MKRNLTLDKLRDGQVTLGSWLSFGSPLVSVVMARCGFDWLVVDTEHGCADYKDMLQSVQTILASEITPIVRVARNDIALIKRALDTGALGILVPMVMNADEAKQAVDASKFPPEGIRSAGGWLAQIWHEEDYFSTANEQILVAVQIEHVDAVKNAKAICNVDGVDVAFVGPNDLAASLGLIDTSFRDNEKWRSALQSVLESANEAGKSAGIHCASIEEAKERIKQGFRFIAVSSDTRLLHSSANQVVKILRDIS